MVYLWIYGKQWEGEQIVRGPRDVITPEFKAFMQRKTLKDKVMQLPAKCCIIINNALDIQTALPCLVFLKRYGRNGEFKRDS